MSERYYEVVNQTKFYTKVTPVTEMESVVGELLTEEETCELYGIEYKLGYGGSCHINIPCYKPIINKAVVDQYLAERQAEATEKGNKTFTVSQEFVDFMDATGKAMSSVLPNSRRVGNRVSFVAKKEKSLYNLYTGDVRRGVQCAINDKYKMSVDIFNEGRTKWNEEDTKKGIEVFKKLISYDEVKTILEAKVAQHNDSSVWYTDWLDAVVKTAVWWDNDDVGEEQEAVETDAVTG